MSEVAALLISEDGSKWAFDTLEGLCWSMFDLLTPRLTRGPWLSFAPVNEAARAAVTANMWQSKRSRDTHKILRLCEAIANQLLRPDGFVFFHVDGDVIWGEGESRNITRFDTIIRAKVRELVRGHISKNHTGEFPEVRLDAVMSKLILLSPHYSIETWLFANVRRLRELGAPAHILDNWERDLTILDRTTKPKDELPLSTREYPTLAHMLASDALYQLGTSFTAAIHDAGACGCLLVRLRRHWPDWVRVEYGLSKRMP